jgi:hypothetical protein
VHLLMDELSEIYQNIHQESEAESELSDEGIETIVCKNLYDHLFIRSNDEDRVQE